LSAVNPSLQQAALLLVRENLQVFCHWSSLAGGPASAKNGNNLHLQQDE